MPDALDPDLMTRLNNPPYGGTIVEQRAWLRAVMRSLGIKGQPFALAAGLAPSTINRFLSEHSRHRLRPNTLKAVVVQANRLLAKQAGGRATIATASTDATNEVHFLVCHHLDAFAQFNTQSCAENAQRAFDRGFLLSLRPSSLADLSLIVAQGDSMLPAVAQGDELLVDRGVRTAKQDGLYLLRAGASAILRRVTLDPLGGSAAVATDNTAYFTLDAIALDRLQIEGLVLWIGRRL